jgi:hypothetical protein
MRRLGRSEIADRRQHGILASSALGVSRDGARTALNDSIPVRERLDGFVRDGGGIGRTLDRSARELSECADSDRSGAGTGVLSYPNPCSLLGECTG